MNDICNCCFGQIKKDCDKITLSCTHVFHYGCFVSMIEYEKKYSFNNCPTCKKDLNVPFYVTKEVQKKNKNTCSICLRKLGYNFLIHTTKCNHQFHKHCIDQWIHLKKNCPNCREELIGHNINKDNIFIDEVSELKEPENIFDNLSIIPPILPPLPQMNRRNRRGYRTPPLLNESTIINISPIVTGSHEIRNEEIVNTYSTNEEPEPEVSTFSSIFNFDERPE